MGHSFGGAGAVQLAFQRPELVKSLLIAEGNLITGGGPGNATNFLSLDLVKMALGQFDLGPAAAMSLIYFLIVLLICWIFYTIMMKDEGKA